MFDEAPPLSYERIGDRLWRFFHSAGYVAADAIRLLPDGTIGGYQHRNECYWCIDNGVLCLLDVDMTITIRFDEVACENGRITFRGKHLPNPEIILCLQERDAPQITRASASETLVKRPVRSFDIFDTLIARTVAKPTDVFDLVEQAGVKDFKKLRLKAQSLSNHTWQSIYANYQNLAGIDDAEVARIQQLELQMETAVSYLISATYHQVSDGDILVSDMYLPRDVLATLLKALGFEKEVEIFVSPGGKASGKIWPVLKQTFDIKHHLGDGLQSDVQGPARHGIPATHYRGSEATHVESLLTERGAVTTAGLVKRFRLTNPFAPDMRGHRLHEAQAVINLPFLLLMSVHLHDIMEREALSRILFTTRDSCLLQPLFELLFPDADSHTFHSSRIAMAERRPSFIAYVSRSYVPGRTLIFDLHGSFKTGRNLFQEVIGSLPRVHIFSGSDAILRALDYPGLTFDVPFGSVKVEVLNLDRVGPLVTVDDSGRPIRAPMSAYAAEVGTLYRTIASRFVECLRPHLDTVRDELNGRCDDISWADIDSEIQNVIGQTPEIPATEFTEHRSLTYWFNQFRSDRGDAYGDAHCYSYIYERLLQEFAARERLSLLEIGSNRDGQEQIFSPHAWRGYLGSKVALYGAGTTSDSLRHHNPADGIHVIAADLSNPLELVRIGLINPGGFDIIIDAGGHVSSHRQTILRTMWKFVRPDGFYIIENLGCEPTAAGSMSMRDLLSSWRDGVPRWTPQLPRSDVAGILHETASIELHESQSRVSGDEVRNALAIIRRQAW